MISRHERSYEASFIGILPSNYRKEELCSVHCWQTAVQRIKISHGRWWASQTRWMTEEESERQVFKITRAPPIMSNQPNCSCTWRTDPFLYYHIVSFLQKLGNSSCFQEKLQNIATNTATWTIVKYTWQTWQRLVGKEMIVVGVEIKLLHWHHVLVWLAIKCICVWSKQRGITTCAKTKANVWLHKTIDILFWWIPCFLASVLLTIVDLVVRFLHGWGCLLHAVV